MRILSKSCGKYINFFNDCRKNAFFFKRPLKKCEFCQNADFIKVPWKKHSFLSNFLAKSAIFLTISWWNFHFSTILCQNVHFFLIFELNLHLFTIFWKNWCFSCDFLTKLAIFFQYIFFFPICNHLSKFSVQILGAMTNYFFFFSFLKWLPYLFLNLGKISQIQYKK